MEACQKLSNQIVPESGAEDHFKKEVMRNCAECLSGVHRHGDRSARELTMVKTRDYPSRNMEQGRGS